MWWESSNESFQCNCFLVSLAVDNGNNLSTTRWDKRESFFFDYGFGDANAILFPVQWSLSRSLSLVRLWVCVQQSQPHKYRTFYFRHAVWTRIERESVAKLCRKQFTLLPQVNKAAARVQGRWRGRGYQESFLLPKEELLCPVFVFFQWSYGNREWYGDVASLCCVIHIVLVCSERERINERGCSKGDRERKRRSRERLGSSYNWQRAGAHWEFQHTAVSVI